MDELLNVINKEIEAKRIEPKYLINYLVLCIDSISEKIVICDDELEELRRKGIDFGNLISTRTQRIKENIEECDKTFEKSKKVIEEAEKVRELIESFFNNPDMSIIDKLREIRENSPYQLQEELNPDELQKKSNEVEETYKLIEFLHNNPNISNDELKEFLNNPPHSEVKEKFKNMLSEAELSETEKDTLSNYPKKLYELKFRNVILDEIIKTSKKMSRYHLFGEIIIVSFSFSLWFFIDILTKPYTNTIIMRLIIGLITVLISYFILDKIISKIRSFRDWKIVGKLRDFFVTLKAIK